MSFKFLSKAKDGGSKSTVTGYWLIELKRLFSIVFLVFGHGSRDEYHDHAFNAISWVFWGCLVEHNLDGSVNVYGPSPFPIITRRSVCHRVLSDGKTYVLSFRGPWAKTWTEFDPNTKRTITLSHGRKVVNG